eukprot:TRINITY_DN5342_c0_g1_i2.p1 TRINITY_DN5342_c0_g1~~TRINITY_DN5342_c0_g1_i2.p1  ORF type:complete len:489 (-),score=139.16 TRINITY_DN5342_c0_g1_i2:85-1551(-)
MFDQQNRTQRLKHIQDEQFDVDEQLKDYQRQLTDIADASARKRYNASVVTELETSLKQAEHQIAAARARLVVLNTTRDEAEMEHSSAMSFLQGTLAELQTLPETASGDQLLKQLKASQKALSSRLNKIQKQNHEKQADDALAAQLDADDNVKQLQKMLRTASASSAPQQDHQAQQISAVQERLNQVMSKIAEETAGRAEAQQTTKQLQDNAKQLAKTVAQKEQDISQMKSDIKVNRIAEKKMLRAMKDNKYELHEDALMTPADAETAVQKQQLSKQELKRLQQTKTPLIDRAQVQAKSDRLQEFRHRLAVIDAAVGQLQTGIDESQNKIEAANTEAYQCIRVKFEEYFHMLVPAKRAQLIRVASTAKIEQGVRFQVKNNEDGEWKDWVQELSGGQRTMLGLAFVFAVAKYRRAPLYLLDEIDAALDELNSDLIAKLVRKVFKGSQVISISHHDGFQRDANVLIHVDKQAGNTVVARATRREPVEKRRK